jgi:hypothetical protein
MVLSFFISHLRLWICFGDKWSWFATAKTQLSEQPTTLSLTNLHTIAFPQVKAQQLPVPQILSIPQIARRFAQVSADRSPNLRVNGRRTAWALRVRHPNKPSFLEPAEPVLDRSRTLAKQLGDLVAAFSCASKKDSMKTVIVSRLLGAKNLLLDSNPHDLNIMNLSPTHMASILPVSKIE